MAYSVRSIIQGSTIYSAGQILTRATGFILIPIYTRHLTPEDYGIIGILNVIVTVLTAALSLGAYQAQTRFYYDYQEDRQKVGELLFTINVILVGFTLLICLGLTFAGRTLFGLVIKSEAITFYPFIVLTIWITFLNIVNQLVPYYYIATKRYTSCSVVLFFQFLLRTGFIILFVVFLGQGALGSVKGMFLGQLAVLALFYWRYARNFVLRFKQAIAGQVLRFGLPIILHATSAALMASIDRVILEKFVPLSEVGVYTLGYQIGLVMGVIVMSINRAWNPHYYELMNQQERDRKFEVRRVVALWLTVIGAVCMIGSLWARDVITLLATERYFDATPVVPLILTGYFFQGMYFFAVSPLFYYKKTAWLPVLTVSSALLHIALNFILIPRYGIMGSAVATTISFLLLALAALVVGRRFFNPGYELGRLGLLAAIAAGSSIWMSRMALGLLVDLGLVVGYLLLSYLMFPAYVRPAVRTGLSLLRSRR